MSKDNEINSYRRIGTTFYKEVEKPLASGDVIIILVPWSAETIRSDHGRDHAAKIEKYTGFCCIPSHLNYQKVIPPMIDSTKKIQGFYNEYHELDHKPKKGDCTTSLEFMKHIFGDHYELGLDYIKLLYECPIMMLPVLCLVSSIRGTGKTTFLNWLKAIFSKNMTLNTNDDFRSQFNSDWANKLIIAVDEVLLDRKEDSERIKNLSTARTFKAEAKGRDRSEIEFFGKFILCSNNEYNFIYLDNEEIRFWVRKIPKFDGPLLEKINFLPQLLNSEIPAFLNFILNRKMHTHKSSRMWFSSDQIETEALRKLKFSNRSKLEREIISYLKIIMEIEELEVICFTPLDIMKTLQNNSSKTDISDIKRILKDKWGLLPQSNSHAYIQYTLCSDGTTESKETKGRYYTFEKSFFSQNFDDFDDEGI